MTNRSEATFGDSRLPQRFWERVKADPSGCWLWTGTVGKGRNAYADCYWKGQRLRAHRFAYQSLVGEIPQGLVCDHLCNVKHCVNPAHIELVTSEENVRRGVAHLIATNPDGPWARRTHCRRGHELTPRNTKRTMKGDRECRECRTCINDARRTRYAAQKEPSDA